MLYSVYMGALYGMLQHKINLDVTRYNIPQHQPKQVTTQQRNAIASNNNNATMNKGDF